MAKTSSRLPIFHSRFPLLTRLLSFQIATGILGLVLVSISYSWLSQIERKSILVQQTEKLRLLLEGEQEQLRTWKVLDLSQAVTAKLDDIEKHHPSWRVSVVPRSELPNRLPPNSIVVPANGVLLGGYIVYAQLLASPSPPGQWGAVRVSLIGLLGVFLLIAFMSFRYVQRNIYRPIYQLNESINQLEQGRIAAVPNIPASGEVAEFIAHIRRLDDRVRVMERASATMELSKKVAHDIRSPLAVLNILQTQLKDTLDPEYGTMLVKTISRIQDIANELLHKGQDTQLVRTSFLPGVLHLIASEKRVQYGRLSKAELREEIDRESLGEFSPIDPQELKRVLSNVIDNAFEALPQGEGTIALLLSKDTHGRPVLEIRDNGIGIAADVLPTLMRKGVTMGKKGGTGLGLFHAKQVVEFHQGSISIQSQPGVGTTVRVVLPSTKPPAWHLPAVVLKKDSTLAIVDDEESVFLGWSARLRKIPEGASVRLRHFKKIEEFMEWFHTVPKSENVSFFFDLEISPSKPSGLDLIGELGLSARAVLVTSHDDEPAIQQRCLASGIKLLPKFLIPEIPVVIE